MCGAPKTPPPTPPPPPPPIIEQSTPARTNANDSSTSSGTKKFRSGTKGLTIGGSKDAKTGVGVGT